MEEQMGECTFSSNSRGRERERSLTKGTLKPQCDQNKDNPATKGKKNEGRRQKQTS